MHDEQYWRDLDLRLHSTWLLCRPADFAPDGFEVIPARYVTITHWPSLAEKVVLVPSQLVPGDEFQLHTPAGTLLVACDLTDICSDTATVDVPVFDEASGKIMVETVVVNRHMVREGKLRPAASPW